MAYSYGYISANKPHVKDIVGHDARPAKPSEPSRYDTSMKINGGLVPQADTLEDVARLVEGVGLGINGDVDLGEHIGKNDRQGRYYRRAAETIGLLNAVSNGVSTLSLSGEKYIAAEAANKRLILINGVMNNPVMRGVMHFIQGAEGAGRTRRDIASWLADNTTLTGDTCYRRSSTVSAWLVDVGLAESRGGNLHPVPAAPSLSTVAPEESNPQLPLAFSPAKLLPYTGNTTTYDLQYPSNEIHYWVDKAKHDRANGMHEQLVEEVAEIATATGLDCRRNIFVDLAAFDSNQAIIFEIKTNHPTNTVAQVRKAVAQLYEYQYQQQLPEAILCLVLENKPVESQEWILDYLTTARDIYPAWKDNDAFGGPPATRQALPWLF